MILDCAQYLNWLLSDTYESEPTEPAHSEDTQMPSIASTSTSTSTITSGSQSKQYPCIIKATNGKSPKVKVKISTLVHASDYVSFTSAYGALLKSSFSTLKKKDKKKKDAKKAKAILNNPKGVGGGPGIGGVAKKTKVAGSGSMGLPKVVGPRRGPGHAKRQQTEKARAKAVKRHLEAKRRRLGDTKMKLLTMVKVPGEDFLNEYEKRR